MAPSSATRSAKALPTHRPRKARTSKGHEATPLASDGEEESGTQAIQVEDEEVAEDIKVTASKLEELKDPNAALDKASRDFLQTLTAHKARITARLEEVRAETREEKAIHEEQIFELLCTALAPVVLGAAPTESKKPLHIEPVLSGGQNLNVQSMRLLKESKALLEEFKELDTRDFGDSPVDKVLVKFNRGRDYTEKLFAAGRKVGQSKIEDMLADARNAVRERRLDSKDEEELGQSVFRFREVNCRDEDVTMEEYEGWGNVAYKASRAAQKMVVVTVRQ